MSDTSNFGFGKFVPGFDFLQSLAKGASGNIPQLPNLSNWVAPTISVEELEKRVEELKAVQFWLEQNSRALAATIQALEVQKMTLATLQGMNFSMGDVANAFKLKTADAMMGSVQKAADTMTGAANTMTGMAARATGRAAAPAEAAPEPTPEPVAPPPPPPPPPAPQAKAGGRSGRAAPAEPAVVDPMQWWGSLTTQFQQIAANAMKDAARQTAVDASRNMATGLAKEAFKTATGMAGQMASKGLKAMPGAKKRSSSAAPAPASRKAAAPKAAAKKATAKKAAAKKSTARSAPRKASR